MPDSEFKTPVILMGLLRSTERELYDRNASAQHIDIGVGTGYFLDKTKWPVIAPSITLVDLNANSLNAASQRIRRYTPETILANALEPLPLHKSFNSAALCYLLHCMPGAIPEKVAVFDHLRPHLEPRARVFGATII
jgi:ubiquinone/menaquinone biosynthesis C-methylase UbiE